MNIKAAVAKLIVLQAGLAITSPVTSSVKKAWPYVPPQNALLPELPAFTNSWDLVREDRFIDMRVQLYTVQMQLFAADAAIEQDRGADIASAFMEQLVDALDADITLDGSVTSHNLRGGSPTLAILRRGDRPYIGLDLFLDLEMKEAKTFA